MGVACLSSISTRRVRPRWGWASTANTVEDTVYTALFNPRMDVHDVIRHTDFENLDIMPANIDLSAAEVQLVTEVGREQVLAGVLRTGQG